MGVAADVQVEAAYDARREVAIEGENGPPAAAVAAFDSGADGAADEEAERKVDGVSEIGSINKHAAVTQHIANKRLEKMALDDSLWRGKARKKPRLEAQPTLPSTKEELWYQQFQPSAINTNWTWLRKVNDMYASSWFSAGTSNSYIAATSTALPKPSPAQPTQKEAVIIGLNVPATPRHATHMSPQFFPSPRSVLDHHRHRRRSSLEASSSGSFYYVDEESI